jgi:hypothetical protein
MSARVGDGQLETIEAAPLLLSIEGHALTGVEFFAVGKTGVLLRFGAARLEVLSNSSVKGAAPEALPGGEAWRKAVSSLVGNRVARVLITRGTELAIEFEGGRTLSVSLRPEERQGLEAAVFFDEHWSYEPY